MLGREDVVTVDKAKELFYKKSHLLPLPEIKTDIIESFGKVLSRDVFSPEDLPQFARSTVDGFALISPDTFGASDTAPSYLNLTDEIVMNEEPDFELKRGEAARIPTGGMLPRGADAVVMLEHALLVDGKMIEVIKPAPPGENVVGIGEDIRKGELVLGRGGRLRPQDVGALAALGIKEVHVHGKPRVAIISTGDEIVPPDAPLQPGQVRDINSYNLAGLIKEAGAVPLRKGIFRDDYNIIKKIFRESTEDSDIVIISGGSSVGAKDMTAKIINDTGPPGVIFHGVSLKPGKPMIAGAVKGIPVFGLPGHPAAVTVCFDIFIRPVINYLSGLAGDKAFSSHKTLTARAARNIASSSGREDHIRVAVEEKDGELWAVPVLGKSGLIRTLVKADGIIVIPLRKLGIVKGESVEVRLF